MEIFFYKAASTCQHKESKTFAIYSLKQVELEMGFKLTQIDRPPFHINRDTTGKVNHISY